jgi:hypothetical protein
MDENPNIIARAYELARCGILSAVEPIIRQLKLEQFEAADSHLQGLRLRNELRLMIKAARTPQR